MTYDEHIRRHPEDSVAYLNRGKWHHWLGFFGEALSDYDTSIMIDSTIAYAYCARASLRATCPADLFRDGQMALDHARTVLKLAGQAGQLIGDWRHRLYLQVLAAAQAENNEFWEAIVLQTGALDLALTKKGRSKISQRLEQYRQGNPLKEDAGLE